MLLWREKIDGQAIAEPASREKAKRPVLAAILRDKVDSFLVVPGEEERRRRRAAAATQQVQ